ncbi:Patatin-like phospholipase [Seminavis robusta]|uniref:Patatin-like phospholipase n=1 Tax=Seminavis robusta TaxID=568900 RepID=A0A9N8HLM0_9STRA|nr:Patatin-like phospholipase [Seminavis robusta]|eukprot:Sro692_g188120.1 Patatin-like phospholipase (351) ;mRNA; f:38550-39602
MAFRSASRKLSQQAAATTIPSFGFSGAGFLVSYHLGASKCFLDHGYIRIDEATASSSRKNVIMGVSGGAIAGASIAAGVTPEDAMSIAIDVAEKTRKEGFLDAFKPGFSLIDQVEEPLLKEISDAVNGDMELLGRRINGKIYTGLTDRSIKPFLKNPKSYCYVDHYRDAEDVVAACMLSSYVPGATGTVNVSPTLSRASSKIREMVELGYVKQRKPGSQEITTVRLESLMEDAFPPFIDGGLCNGFPVFDSSTVVVTPLAGDFQPNRSVCPLVHDDDSLHRLSSRVALHLNRQNVKTFRRMILSSDEDALQRRFSQGHDDAKRFLVQHGLERVHYVVGGSPSPGKEIHGS